MPRQRHFPNRRVALGHGNAADKTEVLSRIDQILVKESEINPIQKGVTVIRVTRKEDGTFFVKGFCVPKQESEE